MDAPAAPSLQQQEQLAFAPDEAGVPSQPSPPLSPAHVAPEQPAAPAEADDDAAARPGQPPRPFDPIEGLKLGALRLASIIKREPKHQDPASAAEPIAEHSSSGHGESPNATVARLKATASTLGERAKVQGSRFISASARTASATAEGLKRLALGEPLQALCRAELAARPCPQLVLLCCTALVSGGGITTERIFQHNPPQELVDRLAAAAGSLSLLPPGASPHAVAGLLKQFLLGLPEPLLTYRLLPQWVAAGDAPAVGTALLQQLPAANLGALRLILQTCHLINEAAATNEMDSQALAEVLAPCVAWMPPPKPASGGGPGPWQGLSKALTLSRQASAAAAAAAHADADGEQAHEVQRITPLEGAELEAVVTVLEHLISSAPSVLGGAPTASSGGAAGW